MQEVSLRELTKTFSGVRAVDRVSIDFHAGEIHALLGENGAGKSTLMNLLCGLYRPDSGAIYLHNHLHTFSSARSALAAGIVMVHQHFMLVPTLTVAENILLALPGKAYAKVKRKDLARQVSNLAARYGIAIENPNALVSTLSVGAQQRVEILKALATNARVVILDEPTAVLTPHEVTNLFEALRRLKKDGYLILLITHKIPEVLAISDRLSILRRGRLILTRETRSCSAVELANLMVEIPESQGSPHQTKDNPRISQTDPVLPLFVFQSFSLSKIKKEGGNAPSNTSLVLYAGEIIGVAGVDGNGQTELAESLMGLRHAAEETLSLKGQQLEHPIPAALRTAGVACIPQDRRKEGLALSLSIEENLLINQALLSHLKRGFFLPPSHVRRFAEEQIARFSITPPIPQQPVSSLSGGNQQRVIIARELSTEPSIVIAVNPSRGLDISATQYVHQQLRELQRRGTGVILISTDLDEILSLSNLVYVLYQGALRGPVLPTTTREELSQMMSGVWEESS